MEIDPANPGGERLGLLEIVALVLMSTLFVALMAQVVLRFFSLSLPWTDTLSVPVFIWLVFVGAAIACRRNEHPFVEIGYMQAERRLSLRAGCVNSTRCLSAPASSSWWSCSMAWRK